MNDKKRERIRKKCLKKLARREFFRQRNYFDRTAKLSQAERDKELAKCERKIAKYSDAEWLRKHNLRYAGGIILAFFAVVYAVLWLVGVSIRSYWGAGILIAVTLVFLVLIASFMDVYRNADKEDNDD